MIGHDRISLKQLEHVRMLALERSFTRAAARLHLSPSALSHSIKALEQGIAVRLFERQRSGVSVTGEGQVIVDHAISILSQFSEMTSAVSRLSGGEEGSAAFGIGPYPASILLAPLVERMAQHCPNISCNVEVRTPTLLSLSLKNGSIDFVICSRLSAPPDAIVIGDTLITIPIRTLVRSDHPLLSRTSVRRDDIRKFPILLNEPDPNVIWAALERGHRSGKVNFIEDVQASSEITRRTDAIWLLAPYHPGMSGDLRPLAIRGLEGQLQSIEIVAVTRPGRALPTAGQKVLETLRAMIAEQAP